MCLASSAHARASLLTGLYAHQAGIGHMVDGPGPKTGSPAYSGELSRSAVTIAEVLKSAGYATYLAGKWHVTQKTTPSGDGDKVNWPLQRGFDRFYGTIHGAGSFFDPNTLVRDNAFISPLADAEYQPREFYYTDAINDHAARFVTEHRERSAEQPLFLHVSYTAAHWPMHAKDADIAKYRGKYDAGYDPIRAARLEKMKRLGLLDPRWQVPPQAGDWSAVDNKAWDSTPSDRGEIVGPLSRWGRGAPSRRAAPARDSQGARLRHQPRGQVAPRRPA